MDYFTRDFLNMFFSRELREAKAQKFMNLKQSSTLVHEYKLKFTHLSMYAPYMVVDSRSQMSKFFFGVSNLVRTKCRNAMLLGNMDISRLMTYAQ